MNIDEQLMLANDLLSDAPDEALKIVSNILNDSPDESRAIFIAGYIFMQAERYGLAYNMLKRAVELVPHREQIYNNLGMCLMKMNKPDEARKQLNKSLSINSNNYPAINNLALLEVNEGNPKKAVELGNKSLKIDPNQWDVRETLGYANLMLGNWSEGWAGYEAMVNNSSHRTVTPRTNAPYWTGEKVKTLHIRGEQGIGDEISFASMINDVKYPVILECDRRLEGLFKRSFPQCKVYGTRFDKQIDWDDYFDAYCLIGSLGYHYRNKDTYFTGSPYLKADPIRKSQWRTVLDNMGDNLKVGIAWTGGLVDTHGERRSLELEQLLPILKNDCDFISLQYKDPTKEIAEFENKHGIKIHHFKWATQTNDYDDTAALVDELDLIITVQTAVVHLAGALGKKTWVLVPNKPHWRYATTHFKWANSVELFRQTSEWQPAIKNVSERLKRLASES